eukprot:gene11609-13552_t
MGNTLVAAAKKTPEELEKEKSKRITSDADQVFGVKRPNTFDFSNVQVPSAMSKGLTTNEDITEYIDPLEKLLENVKVVAEMLKNSKHCVVYTGAGISTSADLPDFRGPNGCWTNDDKGVVDKKKYPSLTEIVPTFAHMAISKLMEMGLVKFVVTTNMDNLHLRSGVPLDKIIELHGNSFKERCTKCKKAVHKDDVIYEGPVTRCECGGLMVDSIVNFAEPIDDEDWRVAQEQSNLMRIRIDTPLTLTPSPNRTSQSLPSS